MAFKSTLCCLIIFACGNAEDLTTHPGHLKPIGSHGKILNVESINYFPDPSVFFTNFVDGSKPLLIYGGAKISPAYSLWTDEYLGNIEKGKEETVIVEQAKKENRSLSPEEIPFTEFVQRYRNEDIYLVNDLPVFLSKDVLLPPSLLCQDVFDYLLAKLMWFSSGGTKSVLHYDSAENINCLFAGTKKLYLIDPNKYSDQVTIENVKSAYSDVDVERVDFVKYPGLAKVEYHYVEMQPGDCLYIPYRWFHHVSSVGRNLAVNIWWSPSAKPQLSNCNLPNTTLEKLTFVGFTKLFPQEIIDAFKGTMKTMFESYENEVKLEYFRLYHGTKSDMFEEGAIWSDEMIEKLNKIFSYLDEPTQDAVLTPEDVESVSEETWAKVVVLVKELTKLVDDQFEADGEDDFGDDEHLKKDEL